ncbi:YggS family pyridoxal phosphate enzyme [Rheinheimera sp. SA_1]|uniref:YggS family pyridoxal phosphate-dependent enzyme n=1 Tax=Rheinheimera sp. SA_1 TaxID=1827365 RepID=UPI0007FBC6DC|nr:YggS family pyridoxal phosphate-dependent enzyme [Rheinheimera sp. SA_1]OBP14936.1 YggS family pyridoxal phosphate enzyme [Rheinheimera sp. SA_1]
MDNNIAERLNSAYRQLAEIKQKNPSVRADAQLIAVSKTKPISLIQEAYLAGQRLFGENYVQELVDKATALAELTDLEWHFIGPIQSNKTRDIAKFASWVHSVDRLKIAERLSAQRPTDMPTLKVLIQVNISDESSKAGIAAAEVLPFAAQIAALPNLQLAGLMAIPAPAIDSDNSLAFARMQALSAQLQQQFPQARALSMGMSDDWQQALTFGATMIRLGTAIFGAREPQPHE